VKTAEPGGEGILARVDAPAQTMQSTVRSMIPSLLICAATIGVAGQTFESLFFPATGSIVVQNSYKILNHDLRICRAGREGGAWQPSTSALISFVKSIYCVCMSDLWFAA